MAGISSKAAGKWQNKRLYNGKELQNQEFSDGSGLDCYDYGARFYDAQIARWGILDPYANKYYALTPFSYCANNPISSIDPNGKEIIITNGYETPEGRNLINQLNSIFANKVKANINSNGKLTFSVHQKLSGQEKILFDRLNSLATNPKQMSLTVHNYGIGFDRYDDGSLNLSAMGKLSLDLNLGRSMGAFYLHIFTEQWHKQAELGFSQNTPDQTYANPDEVNKNDYGFMESHIEGLFAEYELNGLKISNEADLPGGWYQFDFINDKGDFQYGMKYYSYQDVSTTVQYVGVAINKEKQTERARNRAEETYKRLDKIIKERIKKDKQ